MTQFVTASTNNPDAPVPRRVSVPAVPDWVVTRQTVSDLLDVGVSGLLTVVLAPSGAGKTMSVATWAASADLSGGVVWLNLAGANADRDLFWTRLRRGFVEAGALELPAVPDAASADSLRTRMLEDLGIALRDTGPWVVVLDDYPSGRAGPLERDLETMLDGARRGVRLVVVSQSDPALPLHRHAAQGELTRVTAADLVMGTGDVAAVLRGHGVDSSETTVRMVEEHTAGWACGVRLAAGSLATAPTHELAMQEADDAIADFLTREVLDKLPRGVRDLVVRTSVAEVVAPGLARAILGRGSEVTLDASLRRCGFVQYLPDGSFRCHPLLRATARRMLSLGRSDRASEALRNAASWFAEHGDVAMGIRLGVAGGDWAWVARTFVQSWAVPSILLGAAGGIFDEAVQVPAVGEAEPVLLAAVALAHRNANVATAALARAEGEAADRPPASLPDRLSIALARLALARLEGDASTGLTLAGEIRDLTAHVPVARWVDEELLPMVDAQLGALAVYDGDLDHASRLLTRGALGAGTSPTGLAARADCTGQLALLEAYRGNLRRAAHHASSLLAKEPDGAAVGVVHAHLAMAWVHLERSEAAPARQHLDRAALISGAGQEPWIEVAHQLVEARLLVSAGTPEAALQLLAPAMRAAAREDQADWLVDLLVQADAEALLAAGEPERALALVGPRRNRTPGEQRLKIASALSALDDGAAARAALESAPESLSDAPMDAQVEGWLLEARFAYDDARSPRATLLVDRALRTAAPENMRRPFAGAASTWLRRLVDGEPTLLRSHRSFLAELSPADTSSTNARFQAAYADQLIVETLTVREAQVLALLADMCSTEEIAQELYLSVNTIKTYVRGILRKLCVNRRVDAVRRGRELGLC
jgi:LuxR family transcriptional regulator, maltose regulon positive regulatory protein